MGLEGIDAAFAAALAAAEERGRLRGLQEAADRIRELGLATASEPVVQPSVRVDPGDVSIKELGLHPRAWRALSDEGWTTVAHIIPKTDEELLVLNGFGQQSLETLDAALAELGVARVQ